MRSDLVWSFNCFVVFCIRLRDVGVVEHEVVYVSAVGEMCCDPLVDVFVVGAGVDNPLDVGDDRILVLVEVLLRDAFKWLREAELQKAFCFGEVEL